MADNVARALGPWSSPVPNGGEALAAFGVVYADPLVINGVDTPLEALTT